MISPTRRMLIQPIRAASHPANGAAARPMAAGGARNISALVAAFMPKPTSVFWLSMTTVKLMTAKTLDRVSTVVAMTG